MNAVKTNAIRQIESKKYPYKLYEYEAKDGFVDGIKAAIEIGKPAKMVYKTLVTKSTNGDFYIFIIPVERELDLKLAAKAIGIKKIDMIPSKDINKVTGYVKGGCSPIGMKKSYKTIIDMSSMDLDKIIVSGGRVGIQVELNTKDLVEITRAEYKIITDIIV